MPLVMRSFSAYRRSLRPGRRRCRWLLRERLGSTPPASRMPRCPRQTPGPFGKNQDLQCRTGLGITIPANRKSLAGQSAVAATPPIRLSAPARGKGPRQMAAVLILQLQRTRSSRSKTASSPRPKATGSTRQSQSSPNTSHATPGPLITARSARCNCRIPIWSVDIPIRRSGVTLRQKINYAP